jgi:hypothetical protein
MASLGWKGLRWNPLLCKLYVRSFHWDVSCHKCSLNWNSKFGNAWSGWKCRRKLLFSYQSFKYKLWSTLQYLDIILWHFHSHNVQYLCSSWIVNCTYKVPYILESNPHPFYSFRGLKIRCGLDSWSRTGFWKNDRAAIRAVRTMQYNNLLFITYMAR